MGREVDHASLEVDDVVIVVELEVLMARLLGQPLSRAHGSIRFALSALRLIVVAELRGDLSTK
jgi:hypothetical protein